MLKKYKTILAQAEAEIVEKKSRFIATVRPVKTEDVDSGCSMMCLMQWLPSS